MLDILKSILFGIVEGITEWLPISSTGHMILLNEFVSMNVTEDFWERYLVVIQLGAILAVVLIFWDKIWPFGKKGNRYPVKETGLLSYFKRDRWVLWFKILVSCVPAVIVGLLFDDVFDALFYNPICVAIALIVFGVAFLVIENVNHGKEPKIRNLKQMDYKTAFLIGLFQLLAAIFPGTSRSGATILGALLLGVSRTVAAEYTFFLGIPVMFGASLLKLIKLGFAMSGAEALILLIGMVSAFVVSMLVIRFLMGYIRKHDFKVFGWYRIVLGTLVLIYFYVIK